jgi:hypothetical protein
MRLIPLFFLFIFSSALAQLPYIVEDNQKYTFSMIRSDLYQMKAEVSEYTSLDSIGYSEFGLPIYCLKVGQKSNVPSYPILLVGNIHAREDFSSKYVMKFSNLLLQSLQNENAYFPQAKQWLDSLTFYIIPVANPDGLKIAHEDWIEIEHWKDSVLALTRVETLAEWKANGKGTDLNNNFDDGYHLYKKSAIAQDLPASEGYKGCHPADAKEVMALQKFILKTKPLLTLSFHTKGNILFWRDCDTYEKYNQVDSLVNAKVSLKTNMKLADISYNPISYASGLENFVRSRLDLLAVCVELSPSDGKRKQYPDSKFNTLVWDKTNQLIPAYLDELFLLQQFWPKVFFATKSLN